MNVYSGTDFLLAWLFFTVITVFISKGLQACFPWLWKFQPETIMQEKSEPALPADAVVVGVKEEANADEIKIEEKVEETVNQKEKNTA